MSTTLWEFDARRRSRTLDHDRPVLSVAFAPNGEKLAVGSEASNGEASVSLWDLRDYEKTDLVTHGGNVNSLAFSPDGRLLASASSDQTVQITDLFTQESQSLHHLATVFAVDFSSSDGHMLATGGFNHEARIYDTQTWKPIKTFHQPSHSVISLAFDNDDKLLATGGMDGIINLWNLESGRPVETIKGHQSEVNALAFTPDGQRLVSSSLDRSVRLHDVSRISTLQEKPASGFFRTPIAISANGRLLAVGNGLYTEDYQSERKPSGIRIFDLSTGQWFDLDDRQTTVSSLDFRREAGETILAAGGLDIKSKRGRVRFWNVELREWITTRDQTFETPVSYISYSPDGSALGIALERGNAYLMNVDSGKLLYLEKTAKPMSAYCLTFSPDGKYLFVGCGEVENRSRQLSGGNIEQFHVVSGVHERTLKGHAGLVLSLFVSRDGRTIASASIDRTVKLWDVATGEVTHSISYGWVVGSVKISPDGRTLAAGCSDGSVRLWQLATGEELAALRLHDRGALGLAFSRDGETLVASHADRSVSLWSADNRKQNWPRRFVWP